MHFESSSSSSSKQFEVQTATHTLYTQLCIASPHARVYQVSSLSAWMSQLNVCSYEQTNGKQTIIQKTVEAHLIVVPRIETPGLLCEEDDHFPGGIIKKI